MLQRTKGQRLGASELLPVIETHADGEEDRAGGATPRHRRPPRRRPIFTVRHLLGAWCILAVALAYRLMTPRGFESSVGHHAAAHDLAAAATARDDDVAGRPDPRHLEEHLAAERGPHADTLANLTALLGTTPLHRLPAPYPAWVAHATWWHVDQQHHGVQHVDAVLARIDALMRSDIASVAAAPASVVVVLDAGWSHPSDGLRFEGGPYDPDALQSLLSRMGNWQRDGDGAADEPAQAAAPVVDDGSYRHIRVEGAVVWVSGLISVADVSYPSVVRAGWCIADVHGTPHAFRWLHGGASPPTEGCLLDFTSAYVRAWVYDRLAAFLGRHPFVVGLRIAGVDALLETEYKSFAANGGAHVTPQNYAKAYYRFFLDAGRDIRGPDFITVARPVDTFAGRLHFREFAPPDATFAGWVGDHANTFAGMRESAMNVIHSARRGYVSFGVMVGGTPGHRHVKASVKSGDIPASHIMHGSPRVATEADVYADAPPGAGEDDGPVRKRELLLRWAQLAAYLPVSFIGGGTDMLDHDLASGGVDRRREFDADFSSVALRHHAQIAPYLSSVAAHAFHARLLKGDHLVPLDSSGDVYDAPVWVLRPLSEARVFFDAPVDWGFLLGPDVIVAPAMHSFGSELTVVSVPLPKPQWLSEALKTGQWGANTEETSWVRADGLDAVQLPAGFDVCEAGTRVFKGGQRVTIDSVATNQIVTFQRVASLVPLRPFGCQVDVVAFSALCIPVGATASGSTASLWSRTPHLGVGRHAEVTRRVDGYDVSLALAFAARVDATAGSSDDVRKAHVVAARIVQPVGPGGKLSQCRVVADGGDDGMPATGPGEVCRVVAVPAVVDLTLGGTAETKGSTLLGIDSPRELAMWQALTQSARRAAEETGTSVCAVASSASPGSESSTAVFAVAFAAFRPPLLRGIDHLVSDESQDHPPEASIDLRCA